MKKKLVLLLTLIVGISIAFIFTSGFGGKKIQIKEDVNLEILNNFEKSNNPITEKNEEKLGKKLSQSKIKLDFTYLENINSFENVTKKSFDIKGNVKTPEQTFAFSSDRNPLYEVKLENDTILYGKIKVDIKNKSKEDLKAIMNMRYSTETGNVDVSFSSGAIGETAFLPFGDPFLYNDSLDQIRESVQNYESEVD